MSSDSSISRNRSRDRRRRSPATPPATDPAPSARKEFYLGLGIFLLALLLRAIYLAEIHESSLWSSLTVDGLAYHNWAIRLAAGDWIGKDVFYQAPLYPYFLGLLYWLFSPSLLVARLAQALLGATACVLLYRAARNLVSLPVAIVTGLLMAAYPSAIYFDGLMQKASLDLFFVSLLLYLVARVMVGNTRWWSWAGIGAVLGLFVLTRENGLVLLPVLLILPIAQFRSSPWTQRLGRVALVIVGMAAVLFPVAVRNKLVGGEFHLTTSQFGPNFYLGNGAKTTGEYAPLRAGRGSTEYERRDAAELAELATGRKLTPAEVSAYWTSRTLSEIKADPKRWLSLLWRKWRLTWNAVEIADADDQYIHAAASVLLRSLGTVLHFGIIAPLAVLGAWLGWQRRGRLWVLYSSIILFALSAVLFYASARYRYPLVPLLMPLAALTLVEGSALLTARSWRRSLAAIAVLAAAALAVNWPMVNVTGQRLTGQFNLAVALTNQGKAEQAIAVYREVLKANPNWADPHKNLGTLLVNQGRPDEGIPHLVLAVKLNGDSAEAHNELGAALARQGNITDAATHFQTALKLLPTYAEAHNNLARTLMERGSYDAAIEHYRQAIKLHPDFAIAHNDLGSLLAQRGKYTEAAEHFRAAIRAKPDLAVAHNNLGLILLDQGDPSAAAEFREVLRLDPTLTQVQENLRAAENRK